MKSISQPVLSSHHAAWWEPHTKSSARSNPEQGSREPLLSTNTTQSHIFCCRQGPQPPFWRWRHPLLGRAGLPPTWIAHTRVLSMATLLKDNFFPSYGRRALLCCRVAPGWCKRDKELRRTSFIPLQRRTSSSQGW